MANPVITEVTAPATANTGDPFNVVIVATDDDSRSVTLTAQATDSGGNTVTLDATVTITDNLTYSLTSDDPGVTITQDQTDPATFTVTA